MSPLFLSLWTRLRSLFVPTVAVTSVLQARTAANPEEVVLQLFEWERDRLMGLAKGAATAAVTVLTGLIAAAIEDGVTRSAATWFAAGLVAELLLWAGLIIQGLQRLAEQFPLALKLVR